MHKTYHRDQQCPPNWQGWRLSALIDVVNHIANLTINSLYPQQLHHLPQLASVVDGYFSAEVILGHGITIPCKDPDSSFRHIHQKPEYGILKQAEDRQWSGK